MVKTKSELLREFIQVFPTEGTIVPYIELKFRYAGAYGPDTLDELLLELEEQKVLSKFVFNGNINYKLIKDLPVNIGTKVKSSGSELEDLKKIVFKIAEVINDPSVNKLVNEYKDKY